MAVEKEPTGRRYRRVQAGLPMVVRGSDRHGRRFEEQTTCYNISRTGASFSTALDLETGAKIEVVITAQGMRAGSEFSTLAQVMRVIPSPDGESREVGIYFLEQRFPRIYSPETA